MGRDTILGFYEDIREFNSSNIKDFRQDSSLGLRWVCLPVALHLKDMWARDASFDFCLLHGSDTFHGNDVCHSPCFGLRPRFDPGSTTFEAQPVVAQTRTLTSFTIISRIRRVTISSVRVSRNFLIVIDFSLTESSDLHYSGIR